MKIESAARPNAPPRAIRTEARKGKRPRKVRCRCRPNHKLAKHALQQKDAREHAGMDVTQEVIERAVRIRLQRRGWKLQGQRQLRGRISGLCRDDGHVQPEFTYLYPNFHCLPGPPRVSGSSDKCQDPRKHRNGPEGKGILSIDLVR